MSAPPAPSRSEGLPALPALAFACCLWVGLWAFVGRGAMMSEDWTHLATAKGQASLAQAFDLVRVPMRPLQHVVFYGFAQVDELSGGAARLVGLAGHLVALLAVFALGRAWTGSRGAGALACVLFALAPNVASAFSPSALGWPWRVAFSLVALVLFDRHLRGGSWLALLGAVAAWIVALGFHQGALVIPGVAFLRVAFVREGAPDLRRGFLSACLWCALAGAYVVYLQFFREATGHGLKELASLPANVVRATLSLFPEPLRIWGVAGLRTGTTQGWLVGGGVMAVALGVFLMALVRGSALTRFVVVAIALELFLPVLTTGFAARYAYLAGAFAAIALARGATRVDATAAARWLCALAALVWTVDLAQDASEFRAAANTASDILAEARDARDEAAGRPVAILDVPERWGQEQELQYFGLGLTDALRITHGEGPWHVWRTWQNFHTTDVHPMAPEEVARREALGELVVLRWSAAEGRLVATP